MAHTTITLECRGIEIEIDVECGILSGGSDRHGSDEPAWQECMAVAYTHPQRTRPLSPALTRWIETNHSDYIEERLIETHNEW